jgi:hypothetical protein
MLSGNSEGDDGTGPVFGRSRPPRNKRWPIAVVVAGLIITFIWVGYLLWLAIESLSNL